MNLITILQKERSKKTNIEVANYIGYSKERFAELIEIGKRDAFDITRWKILKKMLNLSGL